MTNRYEVVLFDLGGVVVELGGLPVWQAWTGTGDESEVWERWLRSAAVRRFESGRSGAKEFAREIVAEFGLAISPEDFVRQFASWPRGIYSRTLEQVATVRKTAAVGCLSNTNELHWPRFLEEMGLRDAFDHHFGSHELGLLKPDREMFERVVEILGCAPDRVLFLDDNQLNVDGARKAGLHAELARGPDGVEAVLRPLGLLE